MILINFHQLVELDVSIGEVAQVALHRVDHLAEVDGVDGDLELPLFSECGMELNKLPRWDSKSVPMFKSIKLLLQQTLNLFGNMEIRHV